jgi:hypothetical protein
MHPIFKWGFKEKIRKVYLVYLEHINENKIFRMHLKWKVMENIPEWKGN